jgi:hypothetical protein
VGYTTTFEGKFRTRRRLDPQIEAFLTSIETDLRFKAVLADWLEDQQDERADAVRACQSFKDVHRLFHALSRAQADYLRAFSRTRRVQRDEAEAMKLPDPLREAVGLPIGEQGEYHVGDGDPVWDNNHSPGRQPGLWCGWTANEDGTAIVWNQREKFYNYVEWLEYLIERFLGPWGYVLNGEMTWQGERTTDQGTLRVRDNVVKAVALG